jgi:DNA-repair protein XRCC4
MENFNTRFVIENRAFYFRWEWGTDHFSCQVTDGKYAWDGKADQEFIRAKLLPDGMEFSELMDLLNHGFREQDLGQKRFSYQMYAGQVQGDIVLGWKIKIEEDIFIKGNLPLKKQNPHMIVQNMLENFFSKVSVVEKQNETLIQSNKSLQEHNTRALKQMKQMASDKITMEHELMQKFVLVLNEKKKKIRELSDKIKELEKKISEKTPETIPELKFEEIRIKVIEPKRSESKNRTQTTFGSELMEERDPIKPVVRKRHKPVTPSEYISKEEDKSHTFPLSQMDNEVPKFEFMSNVTPPIESTISLALTTKLLKKKELDADDLLEFVLHHQ